MQARDVCLRAADLVAGDRARQHGDAGRVHNHIAQLWATYLGTPITGHDVALMMVLLKVARARNGVQNPDNYLDICGYGAIAGEIGASNA